MEKQELQKMSHSLQQFWLAEEGYPWQDPESQEYQELMEDIPEIINELKNRNKDRKK